MKKIKTALLGLGTVNVGLLKILIDKKDYLATVYALEYVITAVADSSGIAVRNDGFSMDELIKLKAAKSKVSDLHGYLPAINPELITDHAPVDLLIESSPVNLKTGSPGLQAAQHALSNGMNVVFANKAPLVLAFDELHAIAKNQNCRIAYSATVCGGLPVVNVLQRDLIGASLKKFKGILNATTNHILDVLEAGGSLEEGIREAQRVGAAEADPAHDISGHDTANKLFIIMKSFTHYSGSIDDIVIEGIDRITTHHISEARNRGNTLKLIAQAEPDGTRWKLSVRPIEVNAASFLGLCKGWEMGIEFETDYYESISMKIFEEDPMATSAAVFRDAIHVSSNNN